MILNYGLTLHGEAVLPTDVCRGAFYNDRQENNFRVHGNDFIEMDADGNINVLGNVTGYNPQLPNIAPPVTLDYSFNTQAVLSNFRFWLYDTTNGFVEVTDPELGNPIDFIWIDGYYMFTDGEDIYHTLLGDETSIEPVDSGVAQFIPDKSKGLGKTQDDKAIIFSRYSTEYFVNDGTDAFAFTRISSRAIKVGIVATHLKVELNSKWYIVGGAREEGISVHVLGVGSSTKVATREIEKILHQYSEPDLINAHMEAYTIDKTSFIKIHLPNETLLFNETVALAGGAEYAWTILKSDVYGDDPDRSSYSVFDTRIGKWVVGDLTDNKIGLMDDKVATQYDSIVEWLMFSPFMDLEFQSIDEFEIETVSGFTASNDATVFVSITYEGWFYGQEETIEYGMQNEYGRRFIVRQLGYVRDIFSMKLKGASRSRMAFAKGTIKHG